jgi:hypothetical protein
MRLPTLFLTASTLAVSAFASHLSAATVTNITSAGSEQTGGINLTGLGSVNWAAWHSNTPATTTFAELSPFATKTASVGTISGLTPRGTSTLVRGSDTFTSYRNVITWSDGTAAVPNAGLLSGGFGTNVNAFNNGVGFSITNLVPLALGQTYQINVLAAAFNGGGTMTATTPLGAGTSTATQAGTVRDNSNTRNTELFQFSYSPDSITDTLNLTYVLSVDGSGASSHVLIQGVGISIIPEPSTALLLISAATIGLARRTRRA